MRKGYAFWTALAVYSLVMMTLFVVCASSFGFKATVWGLVVFYAACTLGVLALWRQEELRSRQPAAGKAARKRRTGRPALHLLHTAPRAPRR